MILSSSLLNNFLSGYKRFFMNFLRLKDRFRLISYGTFTELFDNLTQVEYRLEQDQFEFLHLFNGTKTKTEILNTLSSEDREVGEEFISNLEQLNALELVDKRVPCRFFPKSCEPYLESINVDITSACNLKCRHCYVGKFYGGSKGEDLTKDDWFLFMDDIAEMNVRSIGITGGEPTIYRDTREIIDYCLSQNVVVDSFFTNGIEINENWVDFLSNLRYPVGIYISLDGHRPELHAVIRGTEETFKKTLKAIHMFVEAGFKVNVNTSVNQYNLPYLLEMYEVVKELKVRRWRLAVPKPLGRFLSNANSLMIDWKTLYPIYTELIDRHLSEIRILGGKLEVPVRIEIELLFRTEMVDNPINYFNRNSLVCFYYKNRCSIKSNGDVLSCAYYEDVPAGNLKKQTIKEIWLGDEMRKTKNLMVKEIIECKDCEHLFFCGGGCRAIAFCITGDRYARDPYACNQVPLFKQNIIPMIEKHGFSSVFKISEEGFEII